MRCAASKGRFGVFLRRRGGKRLKSPDCLIVI
jgi:hypothetical protein